MIQGQPPYTAFGHAGGKNCRIVAEVRRFGSDDWSKLSDVSAEQGLIWSENRWDFTDLDDIEEVRFEVEAKFDLDSYKAGYSVDKVLERVEFGVRVWNKASRTRRWFSGSIRKNTNGKLVGTYKSHPIHASQLGRLKNFAGEIEIEPLVLNTAPKLHDRRSGLYLQKGTILGWSDPILIVLERSRAGLSTLFDFRWAKFSELERLGLTGEEFFKVVWDQKPILYLNLETEHLQTVLLNKAKVGRVARTRDTINALIAHQVLSAAISSALKNMLDLRETEDEDVESVLARMKPQEALVLRAWASVIDPVGGANRRAEDVLSSLYEESPSHISALLVEELPARLQRALSSERKTRGLLAEVATRGDDRD